MAKLILSIFSFLSVAVIASAQQEISSSTQADIRISKEQPTVYIRFERYGKATNPLESRMAETDKAVKSIEDGSDIWLRLHNNTRWAITFSTDSLYIGKSVSPFRLPDGSGALGLNDGMPVSIQYNIQEADGRRITPGTDVSSSSWLPPGRSVLFSVKREDLAKDRLIYVVFGYEWESEKGHIRGREPMHRVEFHSYHLAEKSR